MSFCISCHQLLWSRLNPSSTWRYSSQFSIVLLFPVLSSHAQNIALRFLSSNIRLCFRNWPGRHSPPYNAASPFSTSSAWGRPCNCWHRSMTAFLPLYLHLRNFHALILRVSLWGAQARQIFLVLSWPGPERFWATTFIPLTDGRPWFFGLSQSIFPHRFFQKRILWQAVS